jgi:DNA repair protein RadD
MITLRPYQNDAIESIYKYFAKHDGYPLIVIPTGGGKSLVLAEFVRGVLADYPDQRILILTHVKELIAQNYAELMELWPEAPAGIYSAGLRKRQIGARVLFAGIQSIHRKAFDLQRVDLVLIDEAHLVPRDGETMYRRLIDNLTTINPHLKVIGLTATPFRLDQGYLHRGEGRLFTHVCYDAKIEDLIDAGYLCEPVSVSADAQIKTAGIHTRNGDFALDELEGQILDPDVVRSVVAEIIDHGKDREGWLVFACSVEHGHMLTSAFRAAMVDAEQVYGSTPRDDRDDIIERYKRREFQCLVSVGVLTTGFNAKHVDLLAVVRPTKSTGLWIQMVGRGTRLSPGKANCLVLDFGGNIGRHGPVNRPNVKSSDGAGGGDTPMKKCEDEFCGEDNFISAVECVECHHPFHWKCPECGADVEMVNNECLDCGYQKHRPKERAIATKAATAPIIQRGPDPVAWATVHGVSYSRHHKEGKPPSLKVTYRCGLQSFSEWVCLEHDGYAKAKADAWWKSRLVGAAPCSVDDAIVKAQHLAQPSRIAVNRNGEYYNIVRYEFPDDVSSLSA